MGCRVGAERQAVYFGCIAQRVANNAGFDTRGLRLRIDLKHMVHVFRGINNDGDVDALAVLRSAAAAH